MLKQLDAIFMSFTIISAVLRRDSIFMKESAGEVMVSIQVPTYNHEKYVGQCLRSLLNQKTNYKYEILVGDDCSTDRTRKLLLEFKKKYPDIIKLTYSKKNVGATYNAYHLSRKSNGKYIAFCDGDDFWCDNGRLERDIQFLENHSEYSGICNRCKIVNEDGMMIKKEEIPKGKNFFEFSNAIYTLTDYEKWKMPGQISAVTLRNIYNQDSIDVSILYKAHRNVGDRARILLALMYGNIFCSDFEVSCYRIQMSDSAENFMSQYRKKNLRAEDFKMMCKLEKWIETYYGRCVNLSKIKKERLIVSIVVFLRNPSKENWNVLFEIMKSSHDAKYLWYLIKVVFLKIFYWKILKEDKMIKL